jgi:hypothetical protein
MLITTVINIIRFILYSLVNPSKWLSKYKELGLQNKIEKRIRVVKNKDLHDKITLM